MLRRPRRVYVFPSIIKKLQIPEVPVITPVKPREAEPKPRIRIIENAILKFD